MVTMSISEMRRAHMPTLRIEHGVPNFEGWKRAFDSDPVGRERSGVSRYKIFQSMDDPNYVMIDLEFGAKAETEAFLAAMRDVWRRVEGQALWNPQARIVETDETKTY